MIIGIVLYAIAAVVGIKAVASIFRSFIQPNIALTGAAGAIGFLADKVSGGDGSKVKTLDKDPLKNPDVDDGGSAMPAMPSDFSKFNPTKMATPAISPMGGGAAGGGPGISANLMVGLVNAVGMMPQSGNIANVAKQMRIARTSLPRWRNDIYKNRTFKWKNWSSC